MAIGFKGYNKRGEDCLKSNKYEQAIEYFNKSINLNSNYEVAYFNLGKAHCHLEQYDLAVEYFSKFIELLQKKKADDYKNRGTYTNLDSNLAVAYINRGIAHKFLRQYEHEIEDYTEALNLKPNEDWIRKFYKKFGSFYKINPDYAKVYNKRGIAYEKLGQYEQAIQDYTEAINFNSIIPAPEIHLAHSVGVSLDQLKQIEGTIQDFNKAFQINPDLAVIYNNRGNAYKNLGDEAKAQADFTQAKELGYGG